MRWCTSGLENRARRKPEGSTPLLSATEDGSAGAVAGLLIRSGVDSPWVQFLLLPSNQLG